MGQLSLAPAEDIVWSAHLGGIIVTAWDAHKGIHMFDIDSSKVLQKIAGEVKEHNQVITAMVPALDMTWVGMATGHVLLFHNEELLTWYQPYTEFVRFLTIIPGSGPCEKEECMVVSGGKGFVPLLEDMGQDYEKFDEKGQPLDRAGVLVIWEVYNSKNIRQINLVEENAPNHLETHGSVRQIIHNGEFVDGTCVSVSAGVSDDTYDTSLAAENIAYTPDFEAQPISNFFTNSMAKADTLDMGGTRPLDSLRLNTNNFFSENQRRPTDTEPSLPIPEEQKSTDHVRTLTVTAANINSQVFEILLMGSSQTVRVTCPKPVSLKILLTELQDNTSLSDSECKLEYRKPTGEVVKLQIQKQLEQYLLLPSKPQLFVSPRNNGTKAF